MKIASPLPPIVVYRLLLFFLLQCGQSQGLSCYSCSSDGSGEACLTDPALVQGGTTECYSPNDEFCYTFRLEEEEGGDSEYVEVSVSRGCCRVEEGSTVCPPGDEFQELEQDGYTTLLTRCDSADLCNDGEGDEGRGDEHEGALVVEGVPENYDYFNKEEDDDDAE